MLRLAVVALAVALLAPLLACMLVADFTFESAKSVFFAFVVVAIVLFIVDSFRGRAPA